jgi:hypothetical protein
MGSEKAAEESEYSLRLLSDLHSVMLEDEAALFSADAIERLRALNTAPWRKFRGEGLTVHNLADMLSRFGVRVCNLRKGSKVQRGYKKEQIAKALRSHGK